MGTILASVIIGNARETLADDGTRFTDPTMLAWLNEGQREAVRLKPSVNMVYEPVALVAGTRQETPAGSLGVVGVVKNTNAGGTLMGSAVTMADKTSLDQMAPGWHAENAVVEVVNWMPDANDEFAWYNYPPADGTGFVELMHGVTPTAVATTGTAITIADKWEQAMFYYLMYRAKGKTTKAQELSVAATYYVMFQQQLGLKTRSARPAEATNGGQ